MTAEKSWQLPPALEITSLTKKYGDLVALDQLNLTIQKGELFCLLGPNGGGKSTLFRIISTLMLPDDGNVLISGISLRENRAAARNKIATLFQSPSLDGKLTVRENLRCGGALYGLEGDLLKNRMEEALSAVHLTERLDDLVETLSGGLQRRAEIAKCLLTHPEILLLDEPSSGLDPSARIDLFHSLERLREKEGITAFWTSHIMEEAARADRVGILSEGKLIALGKPQELIDQLQGNVITLKVRSKATELIPLLAQKYQAKAILIEGSEEEIRIEHPDAYQLLGQITTDLQKEIIALNIAQPTLEDVFITHTGKRFDQESVEPLLTPKK